jgi:hypothetical protein
VSASIWSRPPREGVSSLDLNKERHTHTHTECILTYSIAKLIIIKCPFWRSPPSMSLSTAEGNVPGANTLTLSISLVHLLL